MKTNQELQKEYYESEKKRMSEQESALGCGVACAFLIVALIILALL